MLLQKKKTISITNFFGFTIDSFDFRVNELGHDDLADLNIKVPFISCKFQFLNPSFDDV